MSSDGSPYSTRGTGYAHFDGSAWSDIPLSRLEDDRAGWCNVGTVEKDGKTVEFVVSHHASSDANAKTGGLFIITNDGIGSDNWTIIEKLKVAENGPFWPRAVGSGSYIHIWTAYSTASDKKYEGITRPNTYYRYDVATDTWLDEKKLMDGYDATTVGFGWSDAYQMDVDGDNIAIVTGGSGQNVFLFKSEDNGDTWTTTVVDEFPIPAFRGNTSTNGDTLNTNSGSVEVLLDGNGDAHVWWNFNRILDDVEGDSSWSFFPGSNGIVYWNENNTTPRIIAGAIDINENNQIDISGDQTQSPPGGARYSNNTLACFPDAGIDADGNIYLIYSAPNEDALSPEGPVYRDVYVTSSSDGGANWTAAQPIIEGYETEDVFCHIARNVDDNLHLMWQRDDYAGTAVINSHVGTLNKIMYAAVPKSLVLNEELIFNRTSINENNVSFEVSKAYPNPTTGNSFVNVNLEKNSVVKVQITNLVGQEVSSTYVGELAAGSNRIELATQNLNNGVYIYNVFVGNTSVSGRVIVE
jgi:hypothetical protein